MRSTKRPAVIAHRGAARAYPENTLPACAFAIDVQGASGLEVDLCYSRDGVVFLWHDWDPNGAWPLVRESGLYPDGRYRPRCPSFGSRWRKPVDKLDFADIQAHYGYEEVKDYAQIQEAPDVPGPWALPTLDEFFAWACQNPRLEQLFLEIKMPARDLARAPAMLDAVHAALVAANKPPGLRIVILELDKTVLQVLVAHNQDKGYGFVFGCNVLAHSPVVDPYRRRHSAVVCAQRLGISTASLGRPTILTALPWLTYKKLIQLELQRLADASGVTQLILWTVNRPAEMRYLAGLPLGAIVTDDVPALRAATAAV